MPFFENTPAYRPPVSIVAQPARKVPTLQELGFRVIENIKTETILAGLLAKDKVTVKDTGCGEFVGTGKLAAWTTNSLTVDKLVAQDEDCAETFEGTILQGMLAQGHATDSDLTGTEIEKLVRVYLEGGVAKLTAEQQGVIGDLLDLALNEQVSPVVYRDALRIWMLGDKASASRDYNQTDGLRKKLLTKNAVAGSTAANGMYRGAAINFAALEATPALIDDLLQDLMDNSSDELQDIDEDQKAFYLSKSLYRLAKNRAQTVIPEDKSKFEYDKVTKKVTFDGQEVKQLKLWEQYIKADFAGGTSPHLALYTVPRNLVWATDLESDMTTAEFKYEAKTRINWWRVLFRLGAGFAYDRLVAFAI
ncbi:hypothetical protein GCM10023185_31060 [Hymenobacter saemangeumensis]|uniref:Phage major capsid protein n=1 Tax=Hymenobacter saemangeumensis TaxID=1084522 RepID=A0ABP8ILZ3_9BACT